MLNKRKKSLKFRGMRSHGYGSHKKHRGSGHQGGVGMAGTGKKADQKKPNIWKDTKYFGRHGFVSKSNLKIKSVNIFYLEEHFDNLIASGVIKKDGDSYAINLKDLSCNKLLASGTPTKKYKVSTDYASAGAIAKIEEAKGVVTVRAARVVKEIQAPAVEKKIDAKKKK